MGIAFTKDMNTKQLEDKALTDHGFSLEDAEARAIIRQSLRKMSKSRREWASFNARHMSTATAKWVTK